MADIIVSLRHANEQKETDLEVDSDQLIRECIDLIASLKGWISPKLISSVNYSLEAAPGQYPPLDLTFQRANICNGAALIFHPSGEIRAENIPQQPAKPSKDPDRYVLKQLD
jgi:hypothetical protein